jgi:hypothetical protein
MSSKETAYLGIDPGAKGAFCLLVPVTGQVAFKSTTDKPLDLINWIRQIQLQYELRVIMIEDVHSIFGASANSNFNFGYNVSTVNTISQCSGATVDRITPKRWQSSVGVKKKGKAIKVEVGAICERLYPEVIIRGPRGGLLDGKSDALLIAHYAFLKYNQIK